MVVEELGGAVVEGHLDYGLDGPRVSRPLVAIVVGHCAVFVDDGVVVVDLVWEGNINICCDMYKRGPSISRSRIRLQKKKTHMLFSCPL